MLEISFLVLHISTSNVSIPHKRPQLLSILVGIVAELLLELANNRNRILERILPGLEGSGVGRFTRHRHCELNRQAV
jgi:hypothetical protein